eukprot:15361161-Ditylum_brightwellii.AAC.2
MGHHSTFPQLIAFAPMYYGGIGLYTIDREQAVAKISYAMTHIRKKKSIGEEFIIALHCAHLQAGTVHPLLVDTQPIPHLEGKCIRHLHECLECIQGKLYLTELKDPEIYGENNTYVMDQIMDTDNIAAEKADEMNYCQLFLNVKMMSHLTTSDRKRMHREMFNPLEIAEVPPFPYPKDA